jgi:hypothetical protein
MVGTHKRKMISNTNLLLPLWSKVLKIIVYMLNMILFKVVRKTPFYLK